ncbi:MAG: hypothetical protein ACRENI_07765 [Gemmatimonadaceae bacterium]
MSDDFNRRGTTGGVGDDVTRLLRNAYSPPRDPGYWEALEIRIMAAVRDLAASQAPRLVAAMDDRGRWWTVVAGWQRAGAALAAAAVLLAAVAITRSRTAERELAYDAMMKSAAPLPVQAVATPAGLSEREATLHYVISY